MKAFLVAGGLHRWPDAKPVRADDGWIVTSGQSEPERVRPLGISDSERFGGEGTSADVTVHQLYEQLQNAVSYEDDADAAERLAEFCRVAPVPLLCKGHGLSHSHTRYDQGSNCRPPMHDGYQALHLDSARAMVDGLEGVSALAYHLATQRKPASRRLCENALAWPVLGEKGRARHLGRVDRTGHLGIPDARRLVTSTISSAVKQSSLVLDFEWATDHRPQMVLHAHTAVAAYVADVARHITAAGREVQDDLSVTCDVCGVPFVPRRQPGVGAAYCSQPECQKVRKRLNQRARRERLRESGER